MKITYQPKSFNTPIKKYEKFDIQNYNPNDWWKDASQDTKQMYIAQHPHTRKKLDQFNLDKEPTPVHKPVRSNKIKMDKNTKYIIENLHSMPVDKILDKVYAKMSVEDKNNLEALIQESQEKHMQRSAVSETKLEKKPKPSKRAKRTILKCLLLAIGVVGIGLAVFNPLHAMAAALHVYHHYGSNPVMWVWDKLSGDASTTYLDDPDKQNLLEVLEQVKSYNSKLMLNDYDITDEVNRLKYT